MDNEEKTCKNLTTLKALHQTVLTLHNALNNSQSQLNLLKLKLKSQEKHIPIDRIESILRNEKNSNVNDSNPISYSHFILNNSIHMAHLKKNSVEDNSVNSKEARIENDPINKTCPRESNLRSRSCDYPENKEKLSVTDRSLSEGGNDSRFADHTSNSKDKMIGDSDNESEELNDIELIFTTEETKELGVLQEDLVSITEGEAWHTNSGPGQKFSPNSEENQLPIKISNEGALNKVFTHSVLVETDISKCGVIENHQNSNKEIIYEGQELRQINPHLSTTIKRSLKFSSNKNQGENVQNNSSLKSSIRPILVQKQAFKKESEAQTDITALPSHWRSESYLAHKVSYNFTTLPSKFTLPFSQMNRNKSSLKLCDKSQEARRTLLSDINFTSMVPELSKSADHLCQDPMKNHGIYKANKNLCKNTESTDKHENLLSSNYRRRKDNLTPCECQKHEQKSNWEHYYQTCAESSLSIRSNNSDLIEKKRHSLKITPELSKSNSMNQSSSWRSVPTSPILNPKTKITNYYDWTNSKSFHHLDSLKCSSVDFKNKFKSKYKVTFKDSYLEKTTNYGMSCPDLRREYDLDSGDSTDSLIDEAEEYLRSSIDSILTGEDCSKIIKKRQLRRYSEPDLIRNTGPPFNAEPFLPKHSTDLKLNYFVKVISVDGRVLIGRVRYIGIAGEKDPPIGVELSQPFGDTDGTYLGKRMFNCNPDHALFVPFKKVIMAWSY